MLGRMDESYFEEKKQYALEAIKLAIEQAGDALAAIESSRYALPDLISPAHVHELLQSAALKLHAARRDFEKSRWASANTDLEFDEWLKNAGRSDLDFKVPGSMKSI